MIYAFCSDEAFAGTSSSAMQSYDKLNDLSFGVIDDNLINYFVTPTVIIDPRSKSGVNTRLSLTPFSNRAAGRMMLHFDNTRTVPSAGMINSENIPTIDTTLVTPDDQAAIDALTANTTAGETMLKSLFNIIECCFLYHLNATTVPTASDLNAILTSSTDSYSGYVGGSVAVSESVINCNKIRLVNGIYTSQNNLPFRKYVSFRYKVTLTDGNTKDLDLKIWMSNEAFKHDYPISSIVKVVFPCEPSKLLTMDFDNKIAAIVQSVNYITGDVTNPQLAAEIAAEDHSGMTTYTSKYMNNSIATYYRMPFIILYKGASPSSAAMRVYTRNMLQLAVPSVTIAQWKAILPDLFVDASYFLIPMFHRRQVINTDGVERTVDMNIINYSDIQDNIVRLFPNRTFEDISENSSLLMAAGSGLYIFAFPAEGNDEDHKHLSAEHPTYINVDATSDKWENMTEITKEFNANLATIIKMAQGDSSIGSEISYTSASLEGKEYFVFVVNSIEFHVMKIGSFNNVNGD